MSRTKPEVIGRALAAAHCPEPDVAPPARARSASFASAVSDLKVGGEPAAKAMRLDPNLTIEEVAQARATLGEKLRNSVTPAVRRAIDRLAKDDVTATFSIEIGDMTLKSGMYLVALVTRNS